MKKLKNRVPNTDSDDGSEFEDDELTTDMNFLTELTTEFSDKNLDTFLNKIHIQCHHKKYHALFTMIINRITGEPREKLGEHSEVNSYLLRHYEIPAKTCQLLQVETSNDSDLNELSKTFHYSKVYQLTKVFIERKVIMSMSSLKIHQMKMSLA